MSLMPVHEILGLSAELFPIDATAKNSAPHQHYQQFGVSEVNREKERESSEGSLVPVHADKAATQARAGHVSAVETEVNTSKENLHAPIGNSLKSLNGQEEAMPGPSKATGNPDTDAAERDFDQLILSDPTVSGEKEKSDASKQTFQIPYKENPGKLDRQSAKVTELVKPQVEDLESWLDSL